MPYNNSYDEGGDEANPRNPQENVPTHPDSKAADGSKSADESTLLQGVDTYFSDERILIPETEKVIIEFN